MLLRGCGGTMARVRSVLHPVADRGGVPIERSERNAKALGRYGWRLTRSRHCLCRLNISCGELALPASHTAARSRRIETGARALSYEIALKLGNRAHDMK